jgi:hypothetical protein
MGIPAAGNLGRTKSGYRIRVWRYRGFRIEERKRRMSAHVIELRLRNYLSVGHRLEFGRIGARAICHQ